MTRLANPERETKMDDTTHDRAKMYVTSAVEQAESVLHLTTGNEPGRTVALVRRYLDGGPVAPDDLRAAAYAAAANAADAATNAAANAAYAAYAAAIAATNSATNATYAAYVAANAATAAATSATYDAYAADNAAAIDAARQRRRLPHATALDQGEPTMITDTHDFAATYELPEGWVSECTCGHRAETRHTSSQAADSLRDHLDRAGGHTGCDCD